MLFGVPDLDLRERELCSELEELRSALRGRVSEPLAWVGLLHRVAAARAIRASSGIEGSGIELDEAVAAVDGAEPLDARTESRPAMACCRDAMTYVEQLADDPSFAFEASLIKVLHYQMVRYDLAKGPGRWRTNDGYVRDDRSGQILYQGPDPQNVPALADELVMELRSADTDCPVLVRAAMAHLNLAMIHPFRDGNGRMARCLQTLVLAREGDLAQGFTGIEEYLGRKADRCREVLARVGGGSWEPGRDARPWIRFSLTAHYFQIQTLLRRAAEAERRWGALEREADRAGLPARTIGAMWDASLGFRVRNNTYRKFARVSLAVAGRDLKALVNAGLLVARGAARGRFYVAADRLRAIESGIRGARDRIRDPFEETTA